MTQSDKPRQLEAGEFAFNVPDGGPIRHPWGELSPYSKAIWARIEAACIAKGRAEAEERIRELEAQLAGSYRVEARFTPEKRCHRCMGVGTTLVGMGGTQSRECPDCRGTGLR